MNKTIRIRILIIIIFLSVLLIIFRDRSPFGRGNTSFSSQPKNEITKIEFSENGKTLSLEKSADRWLINGEKEARKNGVLFILRILQELEIKSPVTPEMFDTLIKGKGILPVKVKIYEKRRLINKFLVYKTQSNVYGNIMKMKENAKPFIVYVPDYDGSIGSAFTLNELYYLPYTIFNLLPSEIASVNFENFSDTLNSFSIIKRKNHYTINDKKNLTGQDSALVIRYLSYFTWIPFESWDLYSSSEERKNIESQPPLYRITVEQTNGKKTILTLWERSIREKDSIKKDSDRLYGKTQSSDELFIVRYFDIDPLLKKRSYFFPG